MKFDSEKHYVIVFTGDVLIIRDRKTLSALVCVKTPKTSENFPIEYEGNVYYCVSEMPICLKKGSITLEPMDMILARRIP